MSRAIVVWIVAGLLLSAVHSHAPTLALAQAREGPPVAQRIPPSQAAPPTARWQGIKSDPSNARTFYAATAQGLLVSDTGGRSWQSLAIDGRDEEVFALAVHPLTPATLFVGRRDGLWKSGDRGRAWAPVAAPASIPLALAIASSQPDTLYLATARSGVHRSSNGGAQWTEVSTGLPEARAGGRPEEIYTLAVDPSDATLVYAALAQHGIYRSVDGGASWHPFNQGLPFPMPYPIHPPKLAYDPGDPQHPYLAFNQPLHSHLMRTRLYMLADSEEWLPVEADLPANSAIVDLVIDGARRVIQLWGAEVVWEVPIPAR